MARKSAASLGRPVFAVSYDDGWIGVLFPGIPQQVDILVVEVDGVPQIVGLRLDPQYVWLAKSTKDSAPTRLSRSLIRISQDGQRLEWNGPKDVDPTITADLLRSLPLRQLRAMAAAAEYGDGTGDWLEPFSVERTPGEPWPDDHYREVAETYRSAPSAPLKAIQTRWGVSRAAASKWVRKARELGYLGYPKRAGVAGASEPKSPIKSRARKEGSHGRKS